MKHERPKEPRSTNRLARETSPYLLQHAHNPVDWYPWGEEAFRRARELDRPIFLSVGYSSCHWCHVMEHESFEDEETARLMNESFINVKVDREERPDVDAVYMNAVQLMTGHGGWPMSVFLDHRLRPFWGGTYFPPRSRYGMPGFRDVLRSVSEAWREKRGDIAATADQIVGYLESEMQPSGRSFSARDLDRFVELAHRSFDRRYGGFGGAPKFPRAVDLSFLLRVYGRTGDSSVLAMCERTLEAMALGGIYDQVGGGFHRYATDERWLVPHFEKMLYDNALLARIYLEAHQVTGRDFFRTVAIEVLDWILREMTSEEGGFYSATDADSEGGEGSFFVWTPDEVRSMLNEEEARVFCAYFGITPQGNFEGGKSIAHVERQAAEVAEELGLDLQTFEELVIQGRQKLYEAREERPKPFRDEKVLTSWNALAIAALAKAAQVTGSERYTNAATRAADLILGEMKSDGRLLRVRKDGTSKVPGFLDDHAYLADALLDLWETTFDLRWLEEARSLLDFVLRSFRAPGGDGEVKSGAFLYTSDEQEQLIVRRAEVFDGATPASGAVAILALLRLERLTGVASYREAAEGALECLRGSFDQAPMAFAATLSAADFAIHGPAEIAIVGDPSDAKTRELVEAVQSTFVPARVVVHAAPGEVDRRAAEIPLLEGKGGASQPRAFVCRHFTCGPPIDSADELREALAVASAPGG